MAWSNWINVPDVSGVTAGAGDVLSGKVIVDANGNSLTGTMSNKSGTTVDTSTVSHDVDYTYFTVPTNGYYSTSSKIRATNTNTVKFETLWTNSSPTTNMGVTTLTINNLNKYSGLFISARNDKNSSVLSYSRFCPNNSFDSTTAKKLNLFYFDNTSSATNIFRREVNVNISSNTISIEDCKNWANNSTTNGKLIPYKIYGIL